MHAGVNVHDDVEDTGDHMCAHLVQSMSGVSLVSCVLRFGIRRRCYCVPPGRCRGAMCRWRADAEETVATPHGTVLMRETPHRATQTLNCGVVGGFRRCVEQLFRAAEHGGVDRIGSQDGKRGTTGSRGKRGGG